MQQIRRVPVQSNANNTMEEVFGKFEELFKQYDETKTYEEWSQVKILFDAHMLQIEDTSDIESIIDEINKVSSRIFMYGSLCESQQRVVQQLEDEFEKWIAERYVVIDSSPSEEETEGGVVKKRKIKQTETAKENLLKVAYGTDYSKYQEKLRNEKYRLGLVKRVVSGLDSFSYKLHSILNYRQMAIQKGL